MFSLELPLSLESNSHDIPNGKNAMMHTVMISPYWKKSECSALHYGKTII